MSISNTTIPDLFSYQREHFDRILKILSKYKISIDTSCTGSGKTMVATHIAKNFLDSGELKKIVFISPPTLIEHWEEYINFLENNNTSSCQIFSSHSLHKFNLKDNVEYLLIVDECHLFKNSVKRTALIKKIVTKSKYALMLSATPYDDTRQFSNIRDLFSIKTDIKDHISSMDFEYKTKTKYNYIHLEQTDEEIIEYEKGFRNIRACSSSTGNGENVFRPSLFSSGLQKIHDSLIEGCLRVVTKSLTEYINYKIIIVLHYVKHFELIKQILNDNKVLILNGSTPIQERYDAISKFQRNTLKYRVICISSEVGSVGIELDDKYGNFPRHMVILPMSNAISFCQVIGRIQRTNTKSDSKITVIQPDKTNTYFKIQIERKFKVLQQFLEIPKFDSFYEKNDL